MSVINGNWFSIEEDKDVEFVININDEIDKSNKKDLEMYKEKINEMEVKLKDLEMYKETCKEKIKDLEIICNKISNENLKLINRVLEAEISIERTKNILLRKNISFPFTPLTSKFL
jgi:hypothetical protein